MLSVTLGNGNFGSSSSGVYMILILVKHEFSSHQEVDGYFLKFLKLKVNFENFLPCEFAQNANEQT